MWPKPGESLSTQKSTYVRKAKVGDKWILVGRGVYLADAPKVASGEGWVHYMYPRPGDIFPARKSTFGKRGKFPNGKKYLVASGIYDMQMGRALIEDC